MAACASMYGPPNSASCLPKVCSTPIVDYGAVMADVTTFLHASRSLLVMQYRFDKPVLFRAYGAAGVWVGEGYDADPFDYVTYNAGGHSASI